MASLAETAIKLFLAFALGGLVGLERETRAKPAGFRTNILICLGSTLMTIISIYICQKFAPGSGDPGRIAAQVVTGIGFIGAGVIWHSHWSVKGLTSAATIWALSGVGLAIGVGFYSGALLATAIILATLFLLGKFEPRLARSARFPRHFLFTIRATNNIWPKIEEVFEAVQGKVTRLSYRQEHHLNNWELEVILDEKSHQEAFRRLETLAEIKEILVV